MGRRNLTLNRIEPWSALKFGFVVNLSLLAIGMLAAGIVWFFVERLQLISKVCEIAGDMGFVECGVNGGNLFRALFLLGLLGVVVNTGLMVFFAFLYNLIADLVGGVQISVTDDAPARSGARTVAGAPRRPASPPPAPTGVDSRPRRTMSDEEMFAGRDAGRPPEPSRRGGARSG